MKAGEFSGANQPSIPMLRADQSEQDSLKLHQQTFQNTYKENYDASTLIRAFDTKSWLDRWL